MSKHGYTYFDLIMVRCIGSDGNIVRKLMSVLHIQTDFGVVRRFPEGVQADDNGASHCRILHSR